MQKFPDFVSAFSHHLKPLVRHGSQFTCMLFHPRVDGGIPLDSAVESQQVCSHGCPQRLQPLSSTNFIATLTALRNSKANLWTSLRKIRGATKRSRV
jgi:hypothetical protein